MKTKESIVENLGGKVKMILNKVDENFFDDMEEIRIRFLRPLMIKKGGKEFFLSEKGFLIEDRQDAYIPDKQDILSSMQVLSSYSLYAFQEEMKNGFITIEGGHRIGLCGKTVVENGQVLSLKEISSLNIRVSHEKKGCGEKILPFLFDEEGIYHTLILSAPGCGKTTLLRDLIRLISNGGEKRGQSVGIVDERGEIAGTFHAIAQNDIGIRSDCLDCCPKAAGMRMLVRSMAPDVIAVDEIGSLQDVRAMEEIVKCGVRLLCTIHASNLDELNLKPDLKWLMDQKIFKRYVVLKASRTVGEIEGIYDGERKKIESSMDKKAFISKEGII